MASSSLRPGSTDNFLVRQESATAAAAAAEAEAVDNYLPEHANFGVAYDDDDRKAAATNLQSKWRGHSLRRKVAATQMVQKAVRGRLARKAIPAMRTAQEEKDAQVQAQQRQKQSREHRLKRLELELKMMESCDTNAYVKYVQRPALPMRAIGALLAAGSAAPLAVPNSLFVSPSSSRCLCTATI